MITNHVAVFVALSAIVAIAIQLERRVSLFRSLGAALTGILIGMLFSNVGVLPGTSRTYEFLMGPGVNLGIVLILLSVDLRSVLQAGPRMLAAFGIGAAGTAIGAVIGGLALSHAIGPETWKLSGQFTGTYTGGGANFAALGGAFQTSPNLFSAATAADVIVTTVWMATCLAVPVLLGRPKLTQTPEEKAAAAKRPPTLERMLEVSARPVSLMDAAMLVTIAVGAVLAAEQLAGVTPVPNVLWLTTVALLIGQIPAVKRLSGSAMFGNYLLLLFLASNGASSVVANLIEAGPPVFYFAAITVLVHGLIIFGVGHVARLDWGTLAVASQANVGGPASAVALAGARGYADRILPGVAVGLLGYAAGNYVGYGVAALVRTVLGA